MILITTENLTKLFISENDVLKFDLSFQSDLSLTFVVATMGFI